ncbi:MAG TPA: isoprenylcysteine carboxylmethyltransferase family protein [Candidatus Omnitrophota bacterium]|nr:isoprenylcysteine carboxylmethyltransferase family protein [Candidatus Omnitrophota bacterium]
MGEGVVWARAIASNTIGLCVVALFAAIFMNFFECDKRADTKYARKSIVATGTMTLFFVGFYLMVRFQVGVILIESVVARLAMIWIGVLMVVAGCLINIRGRLILRKNWSNHIKIYEDHELVTGDVYGWVRHPLYSSLILMFYGAALVYSNFGGFLATTAVFVPFMYYRAHQEEQMLGQFFEKYAEYKKNVGMFIPRFGKGGSR